MNHIQYHGDLNTTQSCIDAVARLSQVGSKLDQALILTCESRHAFLITLDGYQKIVIQPGFTSGYLGESPKGLASAIKLLSQHLWELDEVNVSKKIFSRIEQCKLTSADLDHIEALPYIRPRSLGDYVYNFEIDSDIKVQDLYPETIPWALIDQRIFDLALRVDSGDSSAIITGFNRFEMLLKERSSLKYKIREAANSVFSNGRPKDQASAEEKFITSVYTLFRNPRAHEESDFSRADDIRCLSLINEMFLIEQAKSE